MKLNNKEQTNKEELVMFLKTTAGYTVYSTAYDSLIGKGYYKIGRISFYDRHDIYVWKQSFYVTALGESSMRQITAFLQELNK